MNIKKTIAVIALSCTTILLSAQSEGVSIAPGVQPPDPSAMLDVSSENKGILIPRVTLTDLGIEAPILTPVETSLMVYNDGADVAVPAGYYYWDGIWKPLGSALWAEGSSGNFIYNINTSEVGVRTGNTQPIADLEINGKSFDGSKTTIPALFVKGRTVFSGGDASLNPTKQIRIGEPEDLPYPYGVGGRWNEINCSGHLDLNFDNGNDVRIGGSNGSVLNGPGADLYVYGTVYSVATGSISDSTLKENIVPIPAGTLNKLASCKGYSYKFKKDPKHKTRSGVLAQEVEVQFPTLVEDVVVDDPKLGPAVTYKTVDYNGLTGILLEAVKELKTIIDAQELRIQALENQ